MISLMAFLIESRGVKSPFLVAAPAAVMDNWARELALWVPQLAVIVYKGAADIRAGILEEHVRPVTRQKVTHSCSALAERVVG